MHFYSLLLGTVLGAIAAGLVFVFVGRKKATLFIAAGVGIVVFAAGVTLGGTVLKPLIQKQQFEAIFADIAPFKTVKKQEPVLFQDIHMSLFREYSSGTKNSQIVDAFHDRLTKLASKRSPYASDEALVAFITATVEQLELLSKKDTALCYKHLFPDADGGIDITEHVPPAMLSKEFDAINQVLLTSVTEKSVPSQEEVLPTIKSLFADLYKEFGSSMAYMESPQSPQANRNDVCLITLNLYKKIIELPPEEGLPTLRWMFANG